MSSSETVLLNKIIDDEGLTAESLAICKLYNYLKSNVIKNLTPDQIRLTSSSGSSVVLIIKDPSYSVVYQYYRCQDTYENILHLQEKLQKLYRSLNYDLGDYVVKKKDTYSQLRTIVWERIIPLNELPIQYIYQSVDRIVSDVIKALHGFHSIGYIHGDCRFDNIGLKNNKFVLFDYNMSHLSASSENDYETLHKSLDFNNLFKKKLDQKLK